MKRDICINYSESLILAAKYLREKYDMSIVNLMIDGWTGETEQDEYTSPVQQHHRQLAKDLEHDCRSNFDKIENLVGYPTLKNRGFSSFQNKTER